MLLMQRLYCSVNICHGIYPSSHFLTYAFMLLLITCPYYPFKIYRTRYMGRN
jgi:hypothetical protein